MLGVICLAILRSPRGQKIFTGVCQFFQTVPFLILLFWVYFGWGFLFEKLFDKSLSPLIAGVIALAISFLCFSGELVVVALTNLKKGTLIAAESLNIRGWPLYRWILLPQLLLQIGGALLNLLLVLMKESALVSVLGVLELTRSAQVYSEYSSEYFEGTLIALMLYWAIAEALQKLLNRQGLLHG